MRIQKNRLGKALDVLLNKDEAYGNSKCVALHKEEDYIEFVLIINGEERSIRIYNEELDNVN